MGNCLGFLRRRGVRRRLSRRVQPQTELQRVQPRPAPVVEDVVVAESSTTTSLREPSPVRDGNDDSVVSKTGVIPAIPSPGTNCRPSS